VRCIYCDKTWGEHCDEDCDAISSSNKYHPVGYHLDDMCECGKILENHVGRMVCEYDSSYEAIQYFRKVIFEVFISEEEMQL